MMQPAVDQLQVLCTTERAKAILDELSMPRSFTVNLGLIAYPEAWTLCLSWMWRMQFLVHCRDFLMEPFANHWINNFFDSCYQEHNLVLDVLMTASTEMLQRYFKILEREPIRPAHYVPGPAAQPAPAPLVPLADAQAGEEEMNWFWEN